MGFLVLMIVTVGATALGIIAATGMLVLLFRLMAAGRTPNHQLLTSRQIAMGQWKLEVGSSRHA